MTLFESRDPLLVFPRDDLTVPQFILDESNAHPTKPIRPVGVPCLIDEVTGKTMHLPELQSRSHALARALKGRWSIGPGDIVSIYSPNELDYPIVAWAVQRLGATLAAHSAALTADELVHQLKIARPALLVTHPGVLTSATTAAKRLEIAADRLVLLEGHLAPDVALPSIGTLINEHEKYPPYAEHCIKPGEAKTAVAFLYFSSGTTGNPKAVCISHYNFMCNVVQNATHNRVHEAHIQGEDRRYRPGDCCGGALPLFHMYGMIQVNYSVFTAMSVVLSRAFNYEQFLRSIEQYRISHLMVVPPHVVLLCKHPLTKKFNLSSVRVCFVSAAPLSAELTEELLRVLPGIELGQGYGLTEATGGVALVPVSQRIGTLGSAGQLLSGTVAKVVKPDGTLAGVGERGEIYIQGPQVALGYLGAEEAAAETFVDGWLRTGDEVLFNEDGDLFITDRIKELIKVKGLQVAPSELEGRLLNHPYIADAGVIGVPHDYAGEVPRAYVVLKPDIAAAAAGDSSFAAQVRDELYKHVSATTAKYKWLEGGIEIVEAIPKSPSGKILRRILKEQSLSSKSSVAGKSRL